MIKAREEVIQIPDGYKFGGRLHDGKYAIDVGKGKGYMGKGYNYIKFVNHDDDFYITISQPGIMAKPSNTNGILMPNYIYQRLGILFEVKQIQGEAVPKLIRYKLPPPQQQPPQLQPPAQKTLYAQQQKQAQAIPNEVQVEIEKQKQIIQLQAQEIANLKQSQEDLIKKDEEKTQKIKQLESKLTSKKKEFKKICKEKDIEIQELKSKSSQSQVIVMSSESKGLQILDSKDINELEKVGIIGSGGGGKVYKVSSRVFYALKEMEVKDADHKKIQNFINEYEIMNLLNHPNILKTFGIFLSDEETPPSILLEFCTCNLENLMAEKSLSNIKIIFIIYQIVEGMKYIHYQKIIHRDLKPSNILIAFDETIKIGDFGISKLMDDEEVSMTHNIGTQKYMAPEILNDDEDYDEKVDVYSFGVLLLFILNGGKLPKLKIGEIFKGKKIELPSSFTAFAKKLIESCLDVDPNNRLSFDEIEKKMIKNNYNLVELQKSELNEVQEKIKMHKERIPKYDE